MKLHQVQISAALVALGIIVGGVLVYVLFSSGGNTAVSIGDDENPNAKILPLRAAATEVIDDTTNRYHNERRNFSLEYPKELALKEIDEGSGAMTVVFQKPNEQVGFQIFIVPYAAQTITEARLKQDLKGATAQGFTDIILPGNIQAVHFTSNSPIIGDSTEVWFIKDGYLYEVTTYADLDLWLAGILATLKFE